MLQDSPRSSAVQLTSAIAGLIPTWYDLTVYLNNWAFPSSDPASDPAPSSSSLALANFDIAGHLM